MRFFPILGAAVFATMVGGMTLPATAQSMSGSGSLADRVKQLEERVQVFEDKDEITRVIMNYGRTLDSGDYVGFGNLYAKNGTWSGGGGGGKRVVYTGPAGIADAMARTYKTAYDIPDGAFHIFTNIMIDVHGDTATGLTKSHFVVPGPNGTAMIRVTGIYHDEFVRENGQWKFLHRVETRGFAANPPDK